MEEMRTLIIAVCDDEPELLVRTGSLIESRLEDREHRLVSFTDPEALLRSKKGPFDIAVLDIQMPGHSGIELARKLLRRSPNCQVIFLTAYMAYCQDVYDVEHIAFVLKEEMESRLPPALDRACRRLARKRVPPSGRMLILGEAGRALQIPAADILYLERRVRVTWVYTLSGTYTTPVKLETLLERLDDPCFCQTHKSFAVHWNFAGRYEKAVIRMRNGVEIPVSRSYAAAVRQSFLAYAARQAAPEVDAP